jgi:hypothetical protein
VAAATAFAATWQTAAGDVVATTFGGTMCLDPVKPWRIRIARDGFEHVVRCGECPGCYEFERRRLADRLTAKYIPGSASGAGAGTRRGRKTVAAADGPIPCLYVIRIYAPEELHAVYSRRLHRRPSLQLERGFARLGTTSFAILARSRFAPLTALRRMGLKHRIETVKFSRGRRAWRPITAGLVVTRERYGPDLNRFYFRGLPAAEREKWEVIKVSKYQSYDRWRSPRAWSDRNLVLVPPQVWAMRRVDRRNYRKLMSTAATPELAGALAALVLDIADSKSIVPVEKKGKLTPDQVRDWYKRMRDRSIDRGTALANSSFSPTAEPSPGLHDETRREPQSAEFSSLPPLSEVGGYRSSEHDQGELLPKALTDQQLLEPGPSGRPRWVERQEGDLKRTQAAKVTRRKDLLAKSLEIIERMRTLAKKRGDP